MLYKKVSPVSEFQSDVKGMALFVKGCPKCSNVKLKSSMKRKLFLRNQRHNFEGNGAIMKQSHCCDKQGK